MSASRLSRARGAKFGVLRNARASRAVASESDSPSERAISYLLWCDAQFVSLSFLTSRLRAHTSRSLRLYERISHYPTPRIHASFHVPTHQSHLLVFRISAWTSNMGVPHPSQTYRMLNGTLIEPTPVLKRGEVKERGRKEGLFILFSSPNH